MPYASRLFAGHTAAFVVGDLEVFILAECLLKRGGKFSFYGKTSLNSPAASLSSFVVYFCIPLQLHSEAARANLAFSTRWYC